MLGSAAPRQRWHTYLGLGLALLTCPCHLPLLLALLAGTALGAWLSQHVLLALLAMSGLFALALLHGSRGLAQGRRQPAMLSSRAGIERIMDNATNE